MLKVKHISHQRIFFALLFILSMTRITYGRENKMLLHPAPIVNFDISHFCLGDTTYFTNTSQLGTSYLWNIYEVENGIKGSTYDSLIYTSTNFNINFLFPNAGHYIIELTGYNGHTVMITRDFAVDSVTHANFDYSYCGSKFVNLSVCYDSCFWNFGDGKTSTEKSPVHFYDTLNAYYKVKLITYNINSTDTFIVDSLYATSPNNLNGNFTYKANKDSILFIASDSVSGPFTQYHWSFGDGTVADLYATNGGRKIYHTYIKKDTTYTVFLLAKTTCLSAFGLSNIMVIDSTPVSSTYIYPNPVSGNSQLCIATERKGDLKEIHIIDCLGKLIGNCAQIETFKGFNIDISDLAKGMYFVQLNFTDKIITKKILKE
jgi:PKD repeat protein